jgi:homoserine kinase type II
MVPPDRRAQLEAGMAAAEQLARLGLLAARPVRTEDGALAVDVPGGAMALQYELPGRPLDGGDPVDQQWWGDLLGRLHRAIAGFTHRGLPNWHRIHPSAAHLGLEPWLRPAVLAALGALVRLTVTDLLTYGILHGDPGPTAFRLDPTTGRTGVVELASVCAGPLCYDLASAVHHAGGLGSAAELIDGYAAAGPVPRDEIESALPVLLRFHWAIQADEAARRLTAGEDSPKLWQRLGEARRALPPVR